MNAVLKAGAVTIFVVYGIFLASYLLVHLGVLWFLFNVLIDFKEDIAQGTDSGIHYGASSLSETRLEKCSSSSL